MLGIAPDAATLLDWAIRHVPARPPVAFSHVNRSVPPAPRVPVKAGARMPSPVRTAGAPQPVLVADAAAELAYEACDWTPAAGVLISEALYEGYALQSIRIPDAKPHPTRLVQSAAMASVAPPKPAYRPHLPPAVVSDGLEPGFKAGAFVPPPEPVDAAAPLHQEIDRLRRQVAESEDAASRAQRQAQEYAHALESIEQRLSREAEERAIWERLAAEAESRASEIAAQLAALQAAAEQAPKAESLEFIQRGEEASAKLDLDEADTRALIDQQLKDSVRPANKA